MQVLARQVLLLGNMRVLGCPFLRLLQRFLPTFLFLSLAACDQKGKPSEVKQYTNLTSGAYTTPREAYAALVAVPLMVLVHFGFADGVSHFWHTVTTPVALSALWLTSWTAFLVGLVNILTGSASDVPQDQNRAGLRFAHDMCSNIG